VALQPTERDQQGSRTPGAENGADKNLDIFHGGYCGLVFDGCRAERGALGTFRGHLRWFSLAPSSAMGPVIYRHLYSGSLSPPQLFSRTAPAR
jgi:hypothetical protein